MSVFKTKKGRIALRCDLPGCKRCFYHRGEPLPLRDVRKRAWREGWEAWTRKRKRLDYCKGAHLLDARQMLLFPKGGSNG